jgi:hypothetical protein
MHSAHAANWDGPFMVRSLVATASEDLRLVGEAIDTDGFAESFIRDHVPSTSRLAQQP